MEIQNINSLVLESINYDKVPWRSGTIPFDLVSLSFGDVPNKGIVLNNLRMVANLNPSFLFYTAEDAVFNTPDISTNGYIIAAKNADQVEFTVEKSGTCEVITHFFGRPKKGRLFDWFYRIFEHGFQLTNFKGCKGFSDKTILNISVRKSDYKHPSLLLGGVKKDTTYKSSARITRVN